MLGELTNSFVALSDNSAETGLQAIDLGADHASDHASRPVVDPGDGGALRGGPQSRPVGRRQLPRLTSGTFNRKGAGRGDKLPVLPLFLAKPSHASPNRATTRLAKPWLTVWFNDNTIPLWRPSASRTTRG